MSAETLRTVLDYCYTGALPDSIGMSALALLMRAAHRFLMRPLLERCEVRASSLLRVSDNGLFAVLDAASANGDDETVAMVRGFWRETLASFLLEDWRSAAAFTVRVTTCCCHGCLGSSFAFGRGCINSDCA